MVCRNIILIAALLLFGCATTQPELGVLTEQAEETGNSRRVSELDNLGTAPEGTDELFINDSNISKKVTVDDLLAYLESSVPGYEVHVDNLPSEYKKVFSLLPFNDSQNVTTGDGAGDLYIRIPATINGWILVDVAAAHQTAATGSGSETTSIQIRNVTQSLDVLQPSWLLKIDEDETDSSTAAAAHVINTSNDDATTGDQWRIDVDAIPSGTAPKGLFVELTFKKP